MKLKRKLLITAILVSVAAMSGCATHSDRIGMTGEAESTQTYAQAYQPAREMLNSGKVEDLRAKMLENDKTADGKVLTNEEMKEHCTRLFPELKRWKCTCTDECAFGYNPNCTCTNPECHCREK